MNGAGVASPQPLLLAHGTAPGTALFLAGGVF